MSKACAQQRERQLRGGRDAPPQGGEICIQCIRTVGKCCNARRMRRLAHVRGRFVHANGPDPLDDQAARTVRRVKRGAQV